MTQDKIKSVVQTWVTPSLMLLLMYFVKETYEGIRDDVKTMMEAIPVIREKENQLEIRVGTLERVVFTDNMGQKETSLPSSTKVVFVKPEEIKLPRE